MILRIFGRGRVIHPKHPEWDQHIGLFPDLAGKRQLIDVEVEMVQTSCGMSIPYFDFKQDRMYLDDWARKKGEDGIKAYWKEKNEQSIDDPGAHPFSSDQAADVGQKIVGILEEPEVLGD